MIFTAHDQRFEAVMVVNRQMQQWMQYSSTVRIDLKHRCRYIGSRVNSYCIPFIYLFPGSCTAVVV